jgi:hypothetical protein
MHRTYMNSAYIYISTLVYDDTLLICNTIYKVDKTSSWIHAANVYIFKGNFITLKVCSTIAA